MRTLRIKREATAAEEDEGWNLPTDVFVEILLRLTPIKRWRLRLVSRHWRDVIHERTPAPEMRVQPAPLAFVVNYDDHHRKISASVYAIDGDLEKGRCTELCQIAVRRLVDNTRTRSEIEPEFDTMMVGTCNGLLCLCDKTKPGGAISLVNPLNFETLAIPLPPFPPGSDQWARRRLAPMSSGWHEAYSFGYEPMTERYKIVHVPCNYHTQASFDVVQVFRLGVASWRNIPIPGGSCCLDSDIISIDGVTYWVTKDAKSVVSFDLKEERVRFTKAPPVRAEQGYIWHLTEVHGKLGIVSYRVDKRALGPEKNEVMVLGCGKDPMKWTRQYSVQVNDGSRRITQPHFVHGDYALTTNSKNEVFAHRVRNAGRWHGGEVRSVKISEQTRGVAAFRLNGRCIRGMFSYVKTKEQLSIYY